MKSGSFWRPIWEVGLMKSKSLVFYPIFFLQNGPIFYTRNIVKWEVEKKKCFHCNNLFEIRRMRLVSSALNTYIEPRLWNEAELKHFFFVITISHIATLQFTLINTLLHYQWKYFTPKNKDNGIKTLLYL